VLVISPPAVTVTTISVATAIIVSLFFIYVIWLIFDSAAKVRNFFGFERIIGKLFSENEQIRSFLPLSHRVFSLTYIIIFMGKRFF
jgi:hypothetical protein